MSYSDLEQKDTLRAKLDEDCDLECQTEGTRWTMVLLFNGITLLLLCFAFVLIAIGSRVFFTRVLGSCLSCWLGCVHFASIIITGIFRFNLKGQLAALCEAGSYYDAEKQVVT